MSKLIQSYLCPKKRVVSKPTCRQDSVVRYESGIVRGQVCFVSCRPLSPLIVLSQPHALLAGLHVSASRAYVFLTVRVRLCISSTRFRFINLRSCFLRLGSGHQIDGIFARVQVLLQILWLPSRRSSRVTKIIEPKKAIDEQGKNIKGIVNTKTRNGSRATELL